MKADARSILIITTVSGFLPKFERENVRLLKEMGFRVLYCANDADPVYSYDPDCFEALGVDFRSVAIAKSPYRILKNFKAYKKIKNIAKKENICAIHCHTPVGGLLGRLLGRSLGVKVIYTAHGFHFYKGASVFAWLAYGGIEKWLAHYTDFLVVINEEDYQAACSFKLRPGGSVCKIPGIGLDTENFKPLAPDERRKSREKLGISDDEFLLVSAGELNKNKNHVVLLHALALLKKDNIRNVRLIVCGEGPERAGLNAKAESFGIAGSVFFPGYRTDLKYITGAADAFAFPSKREGLGMAALEALALGIPVIAADNRGSREYMNDGVNGFVCRENTPEEYCEGIKKMMLFSKNDLNSMKTECKKTSKYFSKEQSCEIMNEIYEKL